MKVQLKYGHHNGDRFYRAGEIMECSKAVYASLVKQGLAVPVNEQPDAESVQDKQETVQAEAMSETAVPQEEASEPEQTSEQTAEQAAEPKEDETLQEEAAEKADEAAEQEAQAQQEEEQPESQPEAAPKKAKAK